MNKQVDTAKYGSDPKIVFIICIKRIDGIVGD